MRIAISIVVILVTTFLTAQLVGLGARTDWLVAGALPGAVVLIAIYRLLGARIEPVAWSAFFILAVAPAYLTPGVVPGVTTMEVVASLVMVGIALAALFTSHLLLAAVFVVHVLWDFVPRGILAPFEGLPLACLFFDLAVAAYVGWQVMSRRWTPFALPFGRSPVAT